MRISDWSSDVCSSDLGGVRSLMYGGNANFYNLPISEYAEVLEFLCSAVGPDTWLIPSFGPDYGRLIDQAKILRGTRVPTAMALPQTFPATPEGVEVGLRRAAVTMGTPPLPSTEDSRVGTRR